MKKILGFIAIILGLIGCLVAWMKENKRNCYKEAGLIDNEEVIDDFPLVDKQKKNNKELRVKSRFFFICIREEKIKLQDFSCSLELFIFFKLRGGDRYSKSHSLQIYNLVVTNNMSRHVFKFKVRRSMQY